MENRTLTLRIEWEPDEVADLSDLGEFTDIRGGYVIDRKTGQLLGEWRSIDWTFPVEAEDVEEHFYGDSPKHEVWAEAQKALEQAIKVANIAILDNSDYYPQLHWELDEQHFYAEIAGYEVLRDNLGRTFQRGTYRYFGNNQHFPHSPTNWAHCEDVVLKDVRGKWGSLEKADVQYFVDDWNRAEDLGVGWSMLGCVVTIEDELGNEIGSHSQSSVESDSGDDYLSEVERECIDAALEQANIGEKVS